MSAQNEAGKPSMFVYQDASYGHTLEHHNGAVRVLQRKIFGSHWMYDGEPFRCSGCGVEVLAADDRWWVPIRDTPGDDQTLTWAGKPITDTVPA